MVTLFMDNILFGSECRRYLHEKEFGTYGLVK
jgi:hypothetical protein